MRHPDWEELEAEAVALVHEAGERGLTLRVVGSTGIRIHCDAAASTMERVRRPAKDIDVVIRGGDRAGIRRMLEERGYAVDRDVLVAMEGTRFAFRHPATRVELDVFVDRLEFCHTIELGERIVRHETTIPIEDLLLQKLQIVEITRGDVADAAVMLATHEVVEERAGPEQVDGGYVARVLGRDWGFHRTATDNLRRVRRAVETGAVRGLDAGAEAAVRDRAFMLLGLVDAAPKSRSWRLRARIGERVQWWDDVSEREDTY
ncbi:MAG: hypothetical protein ACM33B_02230 [Pseudomonadota bacterium]